MLEDYFHKIEDSVEQETKAIRARREEIEREALRSFRCFKIDVEDSTRAKLTAERLVNASVFASQQGNDVSAIAALRVAIEIDDTCWKAYYNLGWHYLSIGKRLHEPYIGKVTTPDETFCKSLAARMSFYQAAMKYLNRALVLNPGDAKGWCMLGQTQYYMWDYDQARASLQKAIDLDQYGEGGRMARESLEILENSLKQ
jgi:tetratricopeptide (TPR) repeat protein